MLFYCIVAVWSKDLSATVHSAASYSPFNKFYVTTVGASGLCACVSVTKQYNLLLVVLC